MMKITRNDISNTLGSVNYALVKRALVDGDINALSRIYGYFLRFDAQVEAELSKRKFKVISLPMVASSQNKAVDDYLKKLVSRSDFLLFIFDMCDAIAHGFSIFGKTFINENGTIYPKMNFYSPRYFHENSGILFAKSFSQKIEINAKNGFFSYFHPVSSGEFFERSLLYHVVSIATLKFMVIDKNMIYYDNLSVPPLIVKSAIANDEESVKAIVSQILKLRAGGVGVFDKEDIVDLLGGGASKTDFLSFIKYCDEAISKLITGQVLAGNGSNYGTQALGQIHNEIRNDIAIYDAKLLGSGVRSLIGELVVLNFGKNLQFDFCFDVNTEKEEKTQIEVYEKISSMGFEIPLEHMQSTFKIPGLKQKSLNHENFISNNSISKRANLDKFDKALREQNFKKTDEELEEALNKILDKCQTYEDAFEEFGSLFYDYPLERLEQIMFKAISCSNILGSSGD